MSSTTRKCIATDSTILKNNPIVLGCTHDYMEMTSITSLGSNALVKKPKLTFLIFFILVSPRILAEELKVNPYTFYMGMMDTSTRVSYE